MNFYRSNKQNHNYNSTVEFPSKLNFSSSISDKSENRISQIENTLQMLTQNFKRDRINTAASINSLEQKIEIMEYKVSMEEKQYYTNKFQLKPLRQSRSTLSLSSNFQSNELSLLKQTMIGDLASQKEEMRNQNAKYQQLAAKQMRLQQQIRDIMTRNKQQNSFEMSQKLNEIKNYSSNYFSKIEYQMEHYKNLMNDIEKKYQQMGDKKNKNESSLKYYFDGKLGSIKNELKHQNNHAIDIVTRLTRESKQSHQELQKMIKNTRLELTKQLQTTQQSTADTFKKLTKNIDQLQDNLEQKFKIIDQRQGNIKEQVSTFANSLNRKIEQNTKIVLDAEGNALERLENQRHSSNFIISGSSIDKIMQELNEWKELTEQKNLNVFRQISNALKAIKLEWRNEHDSLCKEFENVGKTMKNIRKSIRKDIQKETSAITANLQKQLDSLTEQMSAMAEMINLGKKQAEKHSQDAIDKSSAALKDLIFQNKQQLKILIEKNAEAMITNVAQTQKWKEDYVLKLNLLSQSFDQNFKNFTESQNKATKSEIENLKSFVIFNISDNYKKAQQLVEESKKSYSFSQISEKAAMMNHVSKIKDEIVKLIDETSERLKKERLNGEQIIHEACEQTVAETKKKIILDMNNIKTSLQEKITNVIAKQKKGSSQNQARHQQLKTYLQSNLGKINKALLEELEKTNKKIDQLSLNFKKDIEADLQKDRKSSKEEFTNIKNNIELKLKQQDEWNKKKDAEGKAKDGQSQKKLIDACSVIKKDLLAQVVKNKTEIQTKIKNIEELRVKKQSDLLVKLQADTKTKEIQTAKKYENLIVNTKKELSKNITDETNKLMVEVDVKIKQGIEANGKKQAQIKSKQQQFDKKIEAAMANFKKESTLQVEKIKKLVTDESNKNNEDNKKIKIQLQGKLKALNDQWGKKSSEDKSKEQELDKKYEILLATTKKQIVGEIAKQRKTSNDDLAKVKSEVDKKLKDISEQSTKITVDVKKQSEQTIKGFENLRNELNKKIAELKGVSVQTSKAQEAEQQKNHNLKLQTLKKQLIDQIEKLRTQQDVKIKANDTAKKEELALKMSEIKQILNKLQAKQFSMEAKSKTELDKISGDILDIADSLTRIIDEFKPK